MGLKRLLMGSVGKKKSSFIMIVLFLEFCASKSRFLSLLWGFNPLLRLKVPQSSPYGLIPLTQCIASASNQNTDLACKFGSLFFIFSHFKYFWVNSMPFLASYCASHWPHWTITPKYITWVWNQPKHGPWFLILFSVSIFSSLWGFITILGLWRGL